MKTPAKLTTKAARARKGDSCPANGSADSYTAGEHLNVIAELAADAPWKVLRVARVGVNGITAKLVIPSKNGGGWIWDIAVNGNSVTIDPLN